MTLGIFLNALYASNFTLTSVFHVRTPYLDKCNTGTHFYAGPGYPEDPSLLKTPPLLTPLTPWHAWFTLTYLFYLLHSALYLEELPVAYTRVSELQEAWILLPPNEPLWIKACTKWPFFSFFFNIRLQYIISTEWWYEMEERGCDRTHRIRDEMRRDKQR